MSRWLASPHLPDGGCLGVLADQQQPTVLGGHCTSGKRSAHQQRCWQAACWRQGRHLSRRQQHLVGC
jgi:hypothetical protein